MTFLNSSSFIKKRTKRINILYICFIWHKCFHKRFLYTFTILLFSANSLFRRKVISWRYKTYSFFISNLHLYTIMYHYVHNTYFFIYMTYAVRFRSYKYERDTIWEYINGVFLHMHLWPKSKIYRERIRCVCAAISMYSRARDCARAADTRFLHPAIALNRSINYASSLKGELTRFILDIVI